jgi:hypothetical protein
VIIGFAVSEVLRGSARLIRERHLIKFYWPYLLVIPLVFELLIFGFMWIFTLVKSGTDPVWSLLDVAGASLIVVPWAFMSYLVFPSRIKEGFEMKKFCFDTARIVIVIFMVQSVFVLAYLIWENNIPGVVLQVGTVLVSGLVLFKLEKLFVIGLVTVIVAMNFFLFFIAPMTIE